ncbi:MAG: aspartyl protease family protein [Pseudomonadales bacterium]
MKRTAIWTLWFATLVVAFLAGRASIERSSSPAVDLEAATPPGEPWPEPVYDPTDGAPAEADTDRLARARELVREGQPLAALTLVEAHLDAFAGDAQALFLLADLRQMTGDADAALEPLIDILRFPPTPEDATQARRRLDLLINAREQQLIHAGDLAGLVAYFEQLVLAEPAWDGHRLKLARWLARSGAHAEAARLLKEVGTVGVTQDEIDLLAAEIELADARLPVERDNGAMYARASVSSGRRSGSYRLLVDTGATMTGLAEERLVALGARRVEDRVSVQTAAGRVELPVYRIAELKLGSLVLNDLPVLGFDALPAGVDGLLGTDVLARLSGDLPGVVGRPGDPR